VESVKSLLYPGLCASGASFSATLRVIISYGCGEVERLLQVQAPHLRPSGHGPEMPSGSEGIPVNCQCCGEWVSPVLGRPAKHICPSCEREIADDLPM
jgi:hypothetical protein